METNQSSAFGSHILHKNENFKKTLNLVNSCAGKDISVKQYDVQSYITKNTFFAEEEKDYDNLAIFAEKLKEFDFQNTNEMLKKIDEEISDEKFNPEFFATDEYNNSMNAIDEEDFEFDVEVDDGIVRTFCEER